MKNFSGMMVAARTMLAIVMLLMANVAVAGGHKPSVFKTNMGYRCSENGRYVYRIFIGDGSYFDKWFNDDTVSQDSLRFILIGKWDVENIKLHLADRVSFKDEGGEGGRFDVSNKSWDFDSTPSSKIISSSKSSKDIFYVINGAGNGVAMTCQEAPDITNELLASAKDYRQRLDVAYNQYWQNIKPLAAQSIIQASAALDMLSGICNQFFIEGLKKRLTGGTDEYQRGLEQQYENVAQGFYANAKARADGVILTTSEIKMGHQACN